MQGVNAIVVLLIRINPQESTGLTAGYTGLMRVYSLHKLHTMCIYVKLQEFLTTRLRKFSFISKFSNKFFQFCVTFCGNSTLQFSNMLTSFPIFPCRLHNAYVFLHISLQRLKWILLWKRANVQQFKFKWQDWLWSW